MDEQEKAKEKRISLLELEGEELSQELSIEERKAAIAEAKARYGTNWKKILFGAVKSLRINKETLQTLHSMGGGDSSLKSFNDPRTFSKKRRVFEE